MKTKIHFFNPADKNGSEWPWLSRFRKESLALVKERDFWFGMICLLALLFLFVTRFELAVPRYKLGDIAQSTVRASRDIQVPDTLSTERKRKEAQDRVLPVYDYQPGLADSPVSRMHEVFTFLRQAPSGKRNLEKLDVELRDQLNLFVSTEFLSVASRKGYSPELENYLTEKLKKIMSQNIISDRNSLLLYAPKGLTVRNQETAKEENLTVAQIPDVRSAHEGLRTDLADDAALSPSEVNAYNEFLGIFVVPTIYVNSAETQSRLQTAAHNVEPVFYQIKKGKVIVRDGEEVTPTIVAQLNALREAQHVGPPVKYSIAVMMLVSIFFISFRKYLNVHQYSQIKLRGKALFQLCGGVLLIHMALVKLGLLVASSLSTTFTSAPFNLPLAYQIAIPFAAGALLLTLLTDRQIATLYSFAFAMLVGILTKGDFYLLFYCLASGMAATFSIREYHQRSALLRSCLWIWLANLFTVFTIYLLQEMPIGWNTMLFFGVCAFLSAILSAAVASVVSPVLEWLFNITTDIKLLELSNLDLPVLRQLALEAPGTYHHSIVMGTIAEAAAEKVGANPLFLRVSALYHDIGKVRKSDYYVENQRETNKHDTLSPRMSALVIMNHVKEGLEVAKMLRLPSDIRDMIPQHHGTRLITYFYKKAKDMENPEIETVKEEDYRYPGPMPQTKEGAILMLADATEAASRTVTDPTPSRLRNMVDTLFRAIFEDGQLDESNLTMKDLTIIGDAFVRKLESIFHHRIAYPGYEFNRDEKPKDSGESQELSEKIAH